MDQQSVYDSQLQRSVDELDEQQSQESSGQSQIEQENQQINQQQEPKNDNKQQIQQQKRDYYQEYLNPDEDVQANPPLVVAVQGSSKSGKSSIIRSLVKHYTKYKIDAVQGNITLRNNKKQRITLIECPSDISSMMDLAKIADVVLLVIDASLGFEMQTFQFLSLLKCHGFPNVMGVLTHLDFYRDNKQLRKAKKRFKKRYEHEVGGNNKLFYVSKWENGLYPKIESSKIARYVGVTKQTVIPWRQNHPYILVDRWQTQQDQQYQPKDQMQVAFYGYIRGCSYRINNKIHAIGLGDYPISSIQVMEDPCPQYKRNQNKKQQIHNHTQEDPQNDGLQNNDNTISKKPQKKRTLTQSQRIVYAPFCNLGTLNFDYASGFVTIPHEYVKFTKGPQSEQQQQLEEGVRIVRELQNMSQSINEKLRINDTQFELFEGLQMQEQNDDTINKSENYFRKKQRDIRKLKQKTQKITLANPNQDYHQHEDLQYLIYESKEQFTTYDCSKYHPTGNYTEQVKNLFMTAMGEDVLNEMQDDSQEDENVRKQKEIQKITNQANQKAKIQVDTNFYQKGQYVKIVLQKFQYGTFTRLNSKIPLILTRVNLGEDNLGFLKVQFKRHRWYSNLLKSNDPIIVSCGWRKFQSLIVFATQDPNDRSRFLKYTPRHEFCTAVFYGNFVQQNTGCIFSQTIRNDLKKFRIAGSGLVMEINKSFDIMKKVKLIGEPYKIMKNTAFVRGMFNSAMEVANYTSAQIRTVSGIRGQIKKAVKDGGQGTFRATFQDKISMSDLVFCRAWHHIILNRYYNPILTYKKNRLMKTTYELRIEKDIQAPQKTDSEYKVVDRVPKSFTPLVVPKKLEARLPFKTVEKVRQSKKDIIRRAEKQYMPPILQSDRDRQVSSLIQRLNMIQNQKEKRRKEKLKEKQRIYEARQKPKKEYYEKLKKNQKSQKMAKIMRRSKGKNGPKDTNYEND